ncbi:MAG TPA: protein kinase [Isosphaeraceae bacterium]|jgi:serine/threonine-protein kinase|nr:protein kinase [Isosphaeraceae bacterium]
MADPELTHAQEPDDAGSSVRAPAPAGSASGTGAKGADAPTVRSRPSGSGSGPNPPRHAHANMPKAGQRIDTFELEEAIGAGGMGAVYRALDTRLHRLVALKILPPEHSTDAEVLQRFYQEGQSAAQLDHENIARVYTIGSDQNLHYIAFEYIEGTTIRQRVERNGPLPVGEAINYTLQIAGSLVHAAERGVVHRDIKPSNIIVTPQGRAKLVDMGLARRFERGGDHGLTQSGMTLGTFDYISPEQARDPRDVDVRSDLYSLGCTLFHMLTGRPPFPDGTVLQKLLQHQEDPPPDVRALNPDVPPDLAAILVKLMAKDRDRRYQTPEQLVRDLLTVAGSLGLRSISPEGLIWMAAAPRPAWERHLVWALPTAALVLIVAGLLLWGQQSEAPPPPFTADPLPVIAPGSTTAQKPTPQNSAVASQPSSSGASKSQDAPSSTRTAAAVESPQQITVLAGDDLGKAVGQAASGSTIVLADNGPFDLRAASADGSPSLRIDHRDLTIKAAAGVRPVLRLRRDLDPGEDRIVAALMLVGGGRVVLEGLEFLLDPGASDEALDAIVAEDADLSIRRCLFRRPGSRASGARLAAVHVRASAPDRRADSNLLGGGRAAPVVIDACHFASGQMGVLAGGPVDVSLRDCTFDSAEPAFAFDNPEATAAWSSVLRLSHVSILATTGPVFRFSGEGFRVRVDDSVIAPPREAEITLVAATNLDGLDWVGRGNLYARVKTYLLPTRDPLGRAPIQRFNVWTDAALSPREVDSLASNAFIWAAADPQLALEQDDPAQAFLLSASQRPSQSVGARRSPFGPIAGVGELLASATTSRGNRENPADVEAGPAPTSPPVRVERNEPSPSQQPTTPMPAAETSPMPMPMGNPAQARINEDSGLPTMPPIGRDDSNAAPPGDKSPAATSSKESSTSREPAAADRSTSPTTTGAASKAESDPALVRTSQQFLDAMSRLAARGGGTIRVAADAELDLPTMEIRGSGRWVVQAEPATAIAGSGGGSNNNATAAVRPRLRFLPPAADSKRATAWPVLFRVRAGTLQLQGLDISLGKDQTPPSGRWAAFGVLAGTELSLTDCTVTLEGTHPRAALVAVPQSEAAAEGGAANDTSAASVRVTDSLLRSGGDLVDVAPGRRLDLEITDSVVATSASLVHAHGLPRGQTAEPVKMVLRQVTARDGGGLVLLESASGEPELPAADVVARDSIFATTAQGEPLFRVEGQESVDELHDRVRWEGHGVAYHQIGTYRRDQTSQIGTLPVTYDRPSWEVAVAPRDESPLHGDLKFAQDADPYRLPWSMTSADVRLSADSPAHSAGADLSRIPPAPRALR